MRTQPEASFVRIFAVDGAVAGAGFLIAEDKLLTCAHVLMAAIHADENPLDAPTIAIHLDFPLVAPSSIYTAHVLFWQPPQYNGGGDIAVLQLDKLPPDGTKGARLVSDENLWGHSFRAYGFPNLHDNGVWTSGKLRAREATGWVQIEDVKEPGFRVQRGFSGSAVWDEQLAGVVGMVVAAEEDSSIRAAYIIPTDVLIKAWPQLGWQTVPACPYRGLSAFREQDAPYFFGRETFTQQMVDGVRRKLLLAIVGPSGSGKSSVVFAGLIPRLRKEGSWIMCSFRPGSRPFRSLAAALIPLLEPQRSETDRLTEVSKLARRLQEGELALQDVVELIVQKLIGTRLLLFIDEFEELYTLCREPEIRQRFLDELLTMMQEMSKLRTSSFNLVITLRADFVGQALSYRPFADALQYADLKLGPMNRKELQDAIKKPAEKLHVQIEEGLTERILKEVSREPSHLPLLEFALTLLWGKQKDSKLTHSAYEEIGGVEKALADHAEDIYTRLDENEQLQAQRIFVQLVHPGEGTEDIRRLATRAEVGEDNWELVVYLSSARLLVSGQDTTTGEETVELVHEALIRGWKRFQKWVEENREFRLWQERLRTALRQWEKNNRDNGGLLRGALLIEAVTWMKLRSESISQQEMGFLESSQQYQEEEIQRWKSLEEMVSVGISAFELVHRLGNDLGLVDLYLDSIRRELETHGVTSKLILNRMSEIEQSVRKVLDLSQNLKEVLRDSNKTKEMERIFLSPRVIFEESLSQVGLPDNIQTTLETDEDVATVCIIHTSVTDILHNLIVNAIEAMPEGGKLTLKSYNSGRYVALEVIDTGIGIPADHLIKIFNLFYSTKGSSGFGLWSARRNALLNNGDLKVESLPGKGTTFRLLLPKTDMKTS